MTASDLLDVWAASMWRASWQGGLVVAAVWSICRLMPPMPARFQSWFWRLAVVKFMVVLLWLAPIELPWLPPLGIPTLKASRADFAARIQLESRSAQPCGVSTPWLLAFLAWTAGVGWQSVQFLKACCGANRLRKCSRLIEDAKLLDQLAAISQAIGLNKRPALLSMDGQGSPVLVGILRPAVVLPATTLSRLDDSECRMVIGHELAHVRRGDLIWNLIAAIVRAVFFFHPLAWLAVRQMKLAQEIAADELAIVRQRHDPAGYARLLVSVISKLGPVRLNSTIAVGTAGPIDSLVRRLAAMRYVDRDSRRVVLVSAALLGCVALWGIAPWKLVAAEPKLPSIPPTQPFTLKPGETLHKATIKISKGPKGQPKTSLASPVLVFVAGHPASFQSEKKECRVEVAIQSDSQKDPVEHTVQVKILESFAPKLTLHDDITAFVISKCPDGEELEIDVTIEQVEPVELTGTTPIESRLEPHHK